MIRIQQNVDAGWVTTGQGAAPGSAPVQGKLQGRQARPQPHAQKIAQPAEPPAPTTGARRALALRQATPASAPATLLRQARFAALPSVSQVLLPEASAGKDKRATALPSIRQLIERAGPVRSPNVFERFLNIFRKDKSSENYLGIVNALKAYHAACQTPSGEEAKLRLDELTRTLDRYSRSADRNHHRADVIADLRTQITSERTALKTLLAESAADCLPQGATLSQALAFAREGVSLKQMQRLMDQGLTFDQPKKAREILDDHKRSEIHTQRSSGYREILNHLQIYHDFCNGQATEADASTHGVVAQEAANLLNSLHHATNQYLAGREITPHIQAIKDLHDQIHSEKIVLKGMLDEMQKGGALPEGANLSQAMAFAREGVSLHDMARLMSKGLLPSQAMEARELMDSERGSRLVASLQDLGPQRKAVLAGDFSDNELFLLELSGLGKEGGREYRRLGIPITHQTLVSEHTDAQRRGDMTRLGSGAFNEVYAARYSGPEGIVSGVFKPLQNKEDGWVAAKIGIDLKLPQIANRNLATQDVARALGFDVVVECRIGARQQPSSAGPRLQLGLVMGRAPGQEAFKALRHWRTDPEVRREVTKLQLLDHLVGQGDRHGGNYFVEAYKDERGQTKVKVSGIDNDQCFGMNTKDGNDIHYAENRQHIGYRGTKMPELIDSDMAAAIRRITPQSLGALLSDKLKPAEVDAAQSRLQSLLKHISKLEMGKRVLTPDEWNARPDISAFQHASNSYFARDTSQTGVVF